MLAWAMNLGFAASHAGTPLPPAPVVLPPLDQGSVPGFVPGEKPRKRRSRKAGPVMRDDQVFGEEYPVSPFATALKTAGEDEQSRKAKSRRAVIEALLKELL